MRYVCSSGVSLISAGVKWLWITVVKMSVWRRLGLARRGEGEGETAAGRFPRAEGHF